MSFIYNDKCTLPRPASFSHVYMCICVSVCVCTHTLWGLQCKDTEGLACRAYNEKTLRLSL